jgi:hypothetical protein
MTLYGLAVWTGLLCTLLVFAALPMGLFAAGSGHPGAIRDLRTTNIPAAEHTSQVQ